MLCRDKTIKLFFCKSSEHERKSRTADHIDQRSRSIVHRRFRGVHDCFKILFDILYIKGLLLFMLDGPCLSTFLPNDIINPSICFLFLLFARYPIAWNSSKEKIIITSSNNAHAMFFCDIIGILISYSSKVAGG